MINTLTVQTKSRRELIDMTSRVAKLVKESGLLSGLVICFVPHTTASVTINENADPDVRRDILYKLEKEYPQLDGYHHAEGNSDAHLQASLFGFSEIVLVEKAELILGRWQAIYFCEFDGPRRRQFHVRVLSID